MKSAAVFFEKARDFAKINFAFQFLSLYDEASESEDAEKLIRPVIDFVGHGDHLNPAKLSELLIIRDKNIKETEAVSEEADLFRTDEYVLNRIEHKFTGACELPSDYSDLKMTDRLMRYLSSFDEEAQNIHLTEIISELPVRMTKNRFFEILNDRLGIYKESDETAFKDILNAVRSVSGLKASMRQAFSVPDLLTVDHELKNGGKEMTPETFFTLYRMLHASGDVLEKSMTIRVLYEEALNSLVILSIASKYAKNASDPDDADKVIHAVSKLFEDGFEHFSGLSDDVLSRLDLMAETMEQLNEDLNRLSSDIDSGAIADDIHKDASAILTLCFGSRFSDIYADEAVLSSKSLSAETYTRELKALTADFTELFKEADRAYIRAVYARVFSVLPPHFTSQEELETYICDSLAACSSPSEKLAFSDIIREMEEENAGV